MRGLVCAIISFFTVVVNAKQNCVNLTRVGEVHVLAKLESHKYEVNFQTFGAPPQRVILITDKTEIMSEGIIPADHDLWIDNGIVEKMRVPQKNGFDKEYRLIRESAACAVSSPRQTAKLKMPDPKNEPCERKDEDGTIITNPFC